MRALRASERKVMPWKNGGGTTTEIAVFPAGASIEAFDWRVSMATVASDGPFSLFPGVDRTLAILDGAGITLDIAGRGTVTLDRTSPPLAFKADVGCSARLVGDPIVDLNVMTRRGRYRHTVERIEVDGEMVWTAPVSALLMLLARSRVTVRMAGDAVEMFGDDVVEVNVQAPTPFHFTADGCAEVLGIMLYRDP